MVNGTVLPVRTGYESVIASRMPEKYASKAKENGVVSSVSKDNVTILYSNGKKDVIKLYQWTTKEEAGLTYTHELISNLKKNDRVTKGDIVAFDRLFFETDIFNSKNIVMKTGVLVRLQYIESQTTYEDSMTISKEMTNFMTTKTTKVRSMILTKDTVISKLLKVGDVVDYHSKLFTMSDGAEEDVAGYELTKETIDILSEFKNNSPKAKMKGKITKIVFFYRR